MKGLCIIVVLATDFQLQKLNLMREKTKAVKFTSTTKLLVNSTTKFRATKMK
jgi:hypothetical protein